MPPAVVNPADESRRTLPVHQICAPDISLIIHPHGSIHQMQKSNFKHLAGKGRRTFPGQGWYLGFRYPPQFLILGETQNRPIFFGFWGVRNIVPIFKSFHEFLLILHRPFIVNGRFQEVFQACGPGWVGALQSRRARRSSACRSASATRSRRTSSASSASAPRICWAQPE